MGKRVLFIGSVWPEPKSSAGGVRLLQLIHYFNRWGYQVHYAAAAAPSAYAENLADLEVVSHHILLNDSSFDIWVKELSPNVVIYDRFMTEEQFSWRVRAACPLALHVLETIDLHCLRRAREQALKKSGNWEDFLLEGEDSLRELGAILRSDLTLVISSFEMEVLVKWFKVGDEMLYYLPYEAPKYNVPRLSFERKKDFLSIGNFKHAPNWDAVLWLKKEIWPIIRTKLPSASLLICGAYPEEKVWQLDQPKDGFIVKGRIDDAMAEMNAARVLLAPLRFGAGIKGKLVESMLVGTPNVTTKIGTEGLSTDGTWNGLTAEDANDIAAAAIQLYTDQDLWEESVSQGDRLLQDQFASPDNENELSARLEGLQVSLGEHRKKNFLGRLLNHDMMQRTKYFSKWIEVKEKQ